MNFKLIKILLILLIIRNCSYGQMFDSALYNYRGAIVKFLKQNGEIADSSRKDSSFFVFLYSRKIVTFCNINQNIFFETGLLSSHHKKYLGIVLDKQLLLLQTKDFVGDFDIIVNAMSTCNECINMKNISTTLIDIKEMYIINNTSTWRRNSFK